MFNSVLVMSFKSPSMVGSLMSFQVDYFELLSRSLSLGSYHDVVVVVVN